MSNLNAEDEARARDLAARLGLVNLSVPDMQKLLNADRIAQMRRGALDTSVLTPADEPALVFRLPGGTP
jgi:hypothetical protein